MKESEFLENKILSWKALSKKAYFWRFKSQTIGFTNGCFDLLHQGHLHVLCEASDLVDALVVGLNSDTSVRKLKGNNRPIKDEMTRAKLLAGFHFVDAVIIFEEETPYNLIQMLEPDVLVKGGDWEVQNIVGADLVQSKGGNVVTVPYLEGMSTTNIEEKIKKS